MRSTGRNGVAANSNDTLSHLGLKSSTAVAGAGSCVDSIFAVTDFAGVEFHTTAAPRHPIRLAPAQSDSRNRVFRGVAARSVTRAA